MGVIYSIEYKDLSKWEQHLVDEFTDRFCMDNYGKTYDELKAESKEKASGYDAVHGQ